MTNQDDYDMPTDEELRLDLASALLRFSTYIDDRLKRLETAAGLDPLPMPDWDADEE